MASGPAAAQEPAGHSPVILVIETDDGQSVSRSRLNVDAASDLVAAALQAAAGDWAAAPLEWLKAGRVARVRLTKKSNEAPKAIAGAAFATLATLTVAGVEIDLPRGHGEAGGHAAKTAATTWDGAIVLAKYLESHASAVRGKRVLELGAGTGVSGFACAAIGAALVNLSDQKLGLEALRESVRGKFEGRLDVVEGDWLVPPQKWAVSAVAFDVLVASDVVWLDDLIEPLVSVIAHFLFKPNKPILYLSHQTRSASVDLAFFAAVAQRGLACTEVDDFRGDWDFRPENITVFRIARATPAAPAPVPAVPTTPPTLPPPKPHLLVLVHGLHGSPADFKRLSKHLAVQGVRVHATAVNVWSTADGIDAGARRVADDVVAVVENERNGFASLSLVGHSLGGLYARAAAKLLATFRPELPRRVFATIASPHLGALPGPDSRLRPVYRFAAVVASLFSTTVRELTMNDGRAPLLLRIADDEHVDALEAFERRYLWANTKGDVQVPWRSAALRLADAALEDYDDAHELPRLVRRLRPDGGAFGKCDASMCGAPPADNDAHWAADPYVSHQRRIALRLSRLHWVRHDVGLSSWNVLAHEIIVGKKALNQDHAAISAHIADTIRRAVVGEALVTS